MKFKIFYNWFMNYIRKSFFYALIFVAINASLFPQSQVNSESANPPTATSFTYPQSVFVDSYNGNIWVADFDNHRILRFDVSTLTSLKESESSSQPQDFILSQNFPNPFNGETKIAFSTKLTGYVVLSVYNMLGQKITTLYQDVAIANTIYSITFTADNFSSGIYLYSLQTDYGIETKRMCLLK
jgi:hypothetical protein